MKVPLKRFNEEIYYYSSQLVVFFVVIIFITSGSIAMGITSSAIVIAFMALQTFLLASQGHMPVLRFLFSLITPIGFSILRAATSSLDFTETTNILLWGSAIYIGFFQAVSLSLRVGFFKRVAETALSLGSATIFFAFYYYLDMRIGLSRALQAREIDRDTYMQLLKIGHFTDGLKTFIASPQHLFALLGIASFDIMLLASRIRALNLRAKVDKLLEEPLRPAGSPAGRLAGSPAGAGTPAAEPEPGQGPARHLITAISSDIIGFTALSETLGAQRSVDFLNKYYALWTHAASAQGGRITAMNGDSVTILFGLADEAMNPERALYAAYNFFDDLDTLREELSSHAFPADFKISVGVHTGMVVSAMIGAPGELKKGVFGDTMAVAARLDALCRELHQELLVSHSTFRRLSLESQSTLDRMGEVLLRQSTRPVPVYTRK